MGLGRVKTRACCRAVEWRSQSVRRSFRLARARLPAPTDAEVQKSRNSALLCASGARPTSSRSCSMCRTRLIRRRVGIGFYRFLIRTRFHAARVKNSLRSHLDRVSVNTPISDEVSASRERQCFASQACRSTRWCATVREMKGGPSGSAIRSPIPNHRELLWSKAVVVSIAEKPGQ